MKKIVDQEELQSVSDQSVAFLTDSLTNSQTPYMEIMSNQGNSMCIFITGTELVAKARQVVQQVIDIHMLEESKRLELSTGKTHEPARLEISAS